MMSSNNLIHWLFVFYSFQLIFSDRYLLASEGISTNSENQNHVSNNSTILTEVASKQKKFSATEVESKFFSKSNTIIRTGESRALGAKYLNETRWPSHQQCLISCLETFSCNAAVYEEKNMQSCYLFDCGSPSKPLCKFTPHVFFTSSVLKMSQHSYELSQWGKEVQLERGNTEQHHSDRETTSTVHVEYTTPSTSSTILSTSTLTPVKKERVCHHYQFQCVNNSECIAIYNVCDGIPQCPDGSDESTEIQCPTKGDSKGAMKPVNRKMDNAPSMATKLASPKQGSHETHPLGSYLGLENVQQQKIPEYKEQHKEDYREGWPNPFAGPQMPKESDGLGSPFVHKHSQFISANDPHVHDLNRWASDYEQYPPSHSTSLEQQYNPYERMDESYLSNQLPADYDTIKNYGGYRPDDLAYWPIQDGVQDTSYTVDEFPQPGIQNLNKMMGYPDKEGGYARTAVDQFPESKLSMRKPLPMPNSPLDMDDYKLRRYPHSRPYLTMKDSLQQRLSNYPEMKSKGFVPMQNGDDNSYINDDLIRATIVNQLPKTIDSVHHSNDLKQLAKDLMHHSFRSTSSPESTDTTLDNSFIIVKPTSHSKAIQRTVLDFKMSVAELYESSSTHTHEANSAIVALILGITVSVLLMILLACRMKTLRRRMSRKGRALAHDADYLVNGMYL